MTKNERQKQRRLKWLSEGLCGRCGTNKAIEAHMACQPCLNQQKIANAKPEHKEALRKRMAANRKIARDKGLCTTCCLRPPASNRTMCLECLQAQTDARIKQREMVYAAYGNKCTCSCGCGVNTWQFLVLDHVDGNGNQHRKEVGKDLIRWAEKEGFPPSLRLLCANCNTGRERNGGRCPALDASGVVRST
jgi:hypothetical protein